MATAQTIDFQNYSTGIADGNDGGNVTVISADINNDGIPDIFNYGRKGSNVSSPRENRIYLGNSNGTFNTYTTNLFPTTWIIFKAEFIDWNNDSNQDLVVAYSDGTDGVDRITIWFGDGTGEFTEGITHTVTSISGVIEGFSVEKFEGDSNYHIFVKIVNNNLRHPYMFIYNPATNSFTEQSMSGTFGYVMSFISFDYDLDGLPDLVAFAHSLGEPYSIQLFRNMGNMNFSLVPGTPFPTTDSSLGAPEDFVHFAAGNIDNNPDGY